MLINGVEVPEKTAWHPKLGRKEKNIDESRIGGLPYLAPGEDPPECGICGHSMALLMQLRGSDDPRAETEPLLQDEMLQVFWCPGECCFELGEAFSETGKSRQARMVTVTNEGIEHTRAWRARLAHTLAEQSSSPEAAESFSKRYEPAMRFLHRLNLEKVPPARKTHERGGIGEGHPQLIAGPKKSRKSP